MTGDDDSSDNVKISADFSGPAYSSADESTRYGVVNYYFPVEVVYCGTQGLTPVDRETIQAGIFQDLYDAVNRRLV